MIQVPETGRKLGRCLCGAFIREDSFRDEESEHEWSLSGLCQRCQDRIFFARGGDERPYPIRFGALAAHTEARSLVTEVALLPFLFIPERHAIAWEARYTLRIGPLLTPILPFDLTPIVKLLGGHRVHVTEIHAFSDPRLAPWFSDLDLLVALDRPSLEAITGVCPALRAALAVALVDVVPWVELTTCPLIPFSRFVEFARIDPHRAEGSPLPSALRLCAQIGAALDLEEARPLAHLLDFARGSKPAPTRTEGGNP